MKKLKTYQVFLNTQFGIGMQPVRARNKKHAKEKFKKRFPKKRVISVEFSDGYKPIINPI